MMSAKERRRLEVLGRVKRREIKVTQAAELMDVSLRQARRMWKRFKASGDRGLVHALRGRVSNRRLDEEWRDKIVRRHQARYRDFGPTLASEKLSEEGLAISPDTLVTILKERHLWKRMRRRGRHRQCRQRKKYFGQMVQLDGSHHDWFEGRGKKCVLMVMVDDATGQTLARFYEAETTRAAFDVFGRWAKKHGVCRSVYVDRHSIYRDEDHPDKPTQFGRAMAELGVELILAKSPQAKGRVERRHRVFQDRLVKELRLRSISDVEQANVLLEKIMLPELNRRYAIKPALSADLHGPAPEGIHEVLCVQEQRVVGRDWCVRYANRWLQIENQKGSAGLAGKPVLIKQLADGQLLVLRGKEKLSYRELAWRPKTTRQREPKAAINNRRYKPSWNHPYNRQGRADQATKAKRKNQKALAA
jgi:transposase